MKTKKTIIIYKIELKSLNLSNYFEVKEVSKILIKRIKTSELIEFIFVDEIL